MDILAHFNTKGFVGIDLGSYALKAVEVVSGKGGLQVKAFGQVRLPAGCITGGVLKEPEAVAENLRKLVANLRLTQKKTAISLSSYAAIIKRIKLSVGENDDLESAIYEEAEAQIPFNLEDVYLDYQILSYEDQKQDILLVAARKEVIEELINIVKGVGLRPLIIDVDILALGNLVEYVYGEKEPFVVIDLGATKSSVLLWQDAGLLVSRDIPLGSYNISEELRHELNITLEEAEELKINGPQDKTQEEALGKVVKNFYKKFIKDLENTFDYFSSLKEVAEHKRIFLYGGGSYLPKIDEILSKAFGKKVEIIDPFIKLEVTKDWDQSYKKDVSRVGSVALGLALRELVL